MFTYITVLLIFVFCVSEIHAHEQSILMRFQRQLTETIQSDDVLPKLIQYGLMSHEEKNRILLASRNPERMKLVAELIVKKQGNSFDKFCDAIKYKYKKLSDQLIKAKQSPFKVEKPGIENNRSKIRLALHTYFILSLIQFIKKERLRHKLIKTK